MLSDVQRTNISAMFDALDATADGLLSRDDFAVRADQMCAGLAPDAASPHHQELQSAYRQAWDELRYYADCDHDGTVTRDEYVAAVEAGMLTDPEYLEKAVLVVSRALFRAADEDGDGILTRDQYVRMFTAIDLDADMAGAGFDHIDRDADGTIGYDEFVQALSELFSSSDPMSPGSRVLG